MHFLTQNNEEPISIGTKASEKARVLGLDESIIRVT